MVSGSCRLSKIRIIFKNPPQSLKKAANISNDVMSCINMLELFDNNLIITHKPSKSLNHA